MTVQSYTGYSRPRQVVSRCFVLHHLRVKLILAQDTCQKYWELDISFAPRNNLTREMMRLKFSLVNWRGIRGTPKILKTESFQDFMVMK